MATVIASTMIMPAVIVAGMLMFCASIGLIVLMSMIMAVFVPMVLMAMMLVSVTMMLFVFMVVPVLRSRLPGFPGYQVHSTLGATARFVLNNFRVHGADILNSGMQNR